MFRFCLTAVVGLLPLPGCSLLLDFSDIPDGGDRTDASDPCAVLEPNDTPNTAATVETWPVEAAICLTEPADRDFFTFDASGDEDVVIRLSMIDGMGPRSLGIRLSGGDGAGLIEDVDSEADEETIARTLALDAQLESGTYILEVYPSAAGNTNTYTLTIEWSTP